MKYSEKKKVEEFFTKIIDDAEKDMHSYNHISRIMHNARIQVVKFLDELEKG